MKIPFFTFFTFLEGDGDDDKIEVRGCPHGVFGPWVRWDRTWTLAGVSVSRRVAGPPSPELAKLELNL